MVTTTAKDNHFHWVRKPHLRQQWLDDGRTLLLREKDERRTGFMEYAWRVHRWSRRAY